jgi:hypothetical protein
VHIEMRDGEHEPVGEGAAEQPLDGGTPSVWQDDVVYAVPRHERGKRRRLVIGWFEWMDAGVEVFRQLRPSLSVSVKGPRVHLVRRMSSSIAPL